MLRGHRRQRRFRKDPGVGAHHVDATERVGHRARQGSTGLRIAHVGYGADHSSGAEQVEFGSAGSDLLGVAGDDGDIRVGAGEYRRDPFPDPLAGPGDHHGLTREREHRLLLSLATRARVVRENDRHTSWHGSANHIRSRQ